jgi:predicted Fe-S protein YdhL (DUF1289 family)
MQPDSNDLLAAPASPCINVCVLDATGHCLGCLRSIDEIAGWRSMSAAEQWQVIDRLEARRRGRAGATGTSASPPDGGSNEC